MPTCLQEMIHGVNIVQENGSSSGSTSITGLYRFIFNINYITSQPGHKVINHVHVPDVYKVNRLCVKPKQIVQQTDSNSMESNGLSGHYENQCLSVLSHILVIYY